MLFLEMPRTDYRRCKVCGRSTAEVGPLSHNRLCPEDAQVRAERNNLSIHLRRGPEYEYRQYRIAVREFGPRVALALKQSGLLGAATLDDSPVPP